MQIKEFKEKIEICYKSNNNETKYSKFVSVECDKKPQIVLTVECLDMCFLGVM